MPANWSSSAEIAVNRDSVLTDSSFAVQDSVNQHTLIKDTLTTEQIIQQINLLRRRIVETHIAATQYTRIKKDVEQKQTKLISLQNELDNLKAEYEKLVGERNILPEKIISTVDSKISTGR